MNFGLGLGEHSFTALRAGLTALILALLLTPLVIAATRRLGLTARPSADRWHSKPTALFGGCAIVASAVVASLLFLPDKRAFGGIALGALFIFAVGAWDDWRSLRPAGKFVAQLVAACFYVSLAYRHNSGAMPFWAVPLAIAWIVGITNSLNMLDNMDGLSAGVATIVSVLMALNAIHTGDVGVAVVALILAGSTAGFLVYNFNPAKIFMGDCGSMFLGFTLACLTLKNDTTLRAGNLLAALLMPTLILATPVFDTAFVSVVRTLHDRPISQGGRDHTSHRLVLLGLSERRAVAWLYGITLWFGLIALWAVGTQEWLAVITVTVLSVAALMVFGLFLAEVQTYSEEEKARAQAAREGKTVLSRMIKHKRRFVEALLDFGLVCTCYAAAFLVRFEGHLNIDSARELTIGLPYIVAGQMVAFWASGLYRGLWRYVTVSDIGAILRGVFGGLALASLGLFFVAPLPSVHRSVLVIYALLLLVSVVGVRLGLKTLRYHFALKWRDGQKRVLVVGAGDAGELAVREMFNNVSLQLQPIGFLDDDPGKQSAAIHGVRVIGRRCDLSAMIDKMKVDEVVIAMPSIGNGVVQEIIDTCDAREISYREVRGIIL